MKSRIKTNEKKFYRYMECLAIEMTRRCNLNCKFCAKGKAQNVDITHEIIDKTLDEYAIEQEMITHNPCRNVKVVKTEKKEKQVYTMEELIAILEKLTLKAPTDYKLFFSLAIYTGMRRGELLGLEWKDIDYHSGVLSIVRTSNYRNATTGTYAGTPKTKASCRYIKLSRELLTMFEAYHTEQEEQSVKCGDQWQDYDRIFTTWNGEPMHPNTPYTWLQRFCDAEGLVFVADFWK